MAELSTPIGFDDSNSSGTPLTSGANYVIPAETVEPTASGTCMVVVTANITGLLRVGSGSQAFLRVGYMRGTRNYSDGRPGYRFAYGEENGSSASATQTYAVSVSSAYSYRFGCYIYATGGWAHNGTSATRGYCRASWFCQ